MKKLFSLKNVALTLLLVGTIVFAQVFSVQAQSGQQQGQQLNGGNFGNAVATCSGTHNVHGQLFSSTVGWIYLNCADANGVGEFGVDQSAGGYWNGYGWSSSVGWIQFGGLGCPTATTVPAKGASNCNVQRISASGGQYPLVGWARAVPIPYSQYADTRCIPGAGIKNECWDGWISMSGLNDQNPNAGLVQTSAAYRSQVDQTIDQDGHQAVTGFVWGDEVIGWAKFYDAYVDTIQEIQDSAQITLTAVPATVTGSGMTTLTYSIVDTEKDFFTGATCTASTLTTPHAGSPWDGSQPNFSSTSTVFTKTIGQINVPSNPTTYQISCPVSIPTNPNQTAAVATVTVTKNVPAVTLTIPKHDLCVAGSLNGLQTTTVSWVASEGAYCKLYVDGGTDGVKLPLIGSANIGPFNTPTSTNYVTPVNNGDQHQYVVKCYETGSTVAIAESNAEFVGAAPKTFNGSTANGNLNCTKPDWGITIASAGSQVICQSQPASLAWDKWGTVPPQYTYAKLKRDAAQNGTYATTVGTYGLTDTEPAVTVPGWYKVFYYEANGTVASLSSGEVFISGSTSGACHQFSGLTDAGPYCPADSVNTAAYLPKTYAWSSDADSCVLDGTNVSPSGTVDITSAPVTHHLNCGWSDAIAISSADFGPMLEADSAFCSTLHTPGGHPVIIER